MRSAGPRASVTTSSASASARRIRLFIGTSGWNIPRAHAPRFPSAGAASQLARYASRLNAVEINSSFYRSHARATYARWAAAVGPRFRFAVKIPKEITHERRLVRCGAPLRRFLEEIAGLGRKLGPLLVQLPPSLEFDEPIVRRFLTSLRRVHSGPVVIEPRHATWTSADSLLERFSVSRVAADPPRAAGFDRPGGWRQLAYYRLHGSPRAYFSPYAPAFVTELADRLASGPGTEAWCIFDNTGSGAAAGHALDLSSVL